MSFPSAHGSFYVASSRDGLQDVLRVSAVLERAGMRCAFSWPTHFEHICSGSTCGIETRDDLASRELDAASTCDLFIGISRLGKGSHVELGAALVSGRGRIVLVGVCRAESVFYDAGRVEHVKDVADLFVLLGIYP